MKSWQYAIAVNTADKRKKKRNVGKKKKRSLKQRNLLHYTCILYARNTLFLIVAFFMIRVISEGERKRERESEKKGKKIRKNNRETGSLIPGCVFTTLCLRSYYVHRGIQCTSHVRLEISSLVFDVQLSFFQQNFSSIFNPTSLSLKSFSLQYYGTALRFKLDGTEGPISTSINALLQQKKPRVLETVFSSPT